jgi:ankyrin repeat protein
MYLSKISVISKQYSQKFAGLNSYLNNFGITANEVVNVFCSNGPCPKDFFTFLDIYQKHNLHTYLELELIELLETYNDEKTSSLQKLKHLAQEIWHWMACDIDASVYDFEGNNLLILASSIGDLPILTKVFEAPERPDINVINKDGVSALCAAVTHGCYEAAKFLLEHQTNPFLAYQGHLLDDHICIYDFSSQCNVHKQLIQELLATYEQKALLRDISPRFPGS